MKIYTRIIYIIFLTCIVPLMLSAQSHSNIVLSPVGKLNNVKLKQDYAYYLFKANQNYLTWYEGYTSTIFIYNLNKKKVKKITLREGRGPNEYKKISDLSISDGIIYLVDYINAKLIRIEVSGTFLKDVHLSLNLRPIKMASNSRYKIFMDIHKQDAIFYLQENGKLKPLILKRDDLIKEFPNLFYKVGSLTIQDNYLIHYAKYYPHIYIYDLRTRKMEKKIIFDESEVKEGRTKSNDDGAKVTLPPLEVDILSEDVVHIPSLSNRILLLAKGASDDRKYKLDQLYEYNFRKEEFVTTYNLGVQAIEITANDNYLFVYAKEKNAIFQYKFRPIK